MNETDTKHREQAPAPPPPGSVPFSINRWQTKPDLYREVVAVETVKLKSALNQEDGFRKSLVVQFNAD